MVETYLSRKHRNSMQRKGFTDGDSSCSGSPRSALASDRTATQEDEAVFAIANEIPGAPGEEIEMDE